MKQRFLCKTCNKECVGLNMAKAHTYQHYADPKTIKIQDLFETITGTRQDFTKWIEERIKNKHHKALAKHVARYHGPLNENLCNCDPNRILKEIFLSDVPYRPFTQVPAALKILRNDPRANPMLVKRVIENHGANGLILMAAGWPQHFTTYELEQLIKEYASSAKNEDLEECIPYQKVLAHIHGIPYKDLRLTAKVIRS